MDKIAVQDSFRRGMFRGVPRHLIPPDGCYDLLNYLLAQDGLPYKRGGSAYRIPAVASAAVSALWDGRTVGGDRTLFISDESPGKLYVVPADDVSAGVLVQTLTNTPGPWKFSESNGLVAISGPSGRVVLYGGSRKTANYAVGTITLSVGSPQITGAGTSWLANVDAGMIVEIQGVPGSTPPFNGDFNYVKSVDSNTQIQLLNPVNVGTPQAPGAALAGVSYTIYPSYEVSSVLAGRAELMQGRLLGVGSPATKLRMSSLIGGRPEYKTFSEFDYHELPGEILGVYGLRGNAYVFTTAGLYVVTNIAFDLVDAAGNIQQTVERVDGTLTLVGEQGVVSWGQALVVPAISGVWLMDGSGPPVLLSRSIKELWDSYMTAGYKAGQAFVIRNTYCVPILDSSRACQGWLACKLDSGDGEGHWPWTRFSTGFARAGTVRRRSGAAPVVLGGPDIGTTRLMTLSWFDPAAAVRFEAEGSAPTFTIESRDHPTGDGQDNTVQEVRVDYDLVDAAADNPVFTFSYAKEDGSYTAHPDAGAEGAPVSKRWRFAKRGRYFRWKLSCSALAASAQVRTVEIWARGSRRR